jgi:hypothetical protein
LGWEISCILFWNRFLHMWGLLSICLWVCFKTVESSRCYF